ncbi:MAG TPA: hypothetical protein PL070_20715 [Flavobacteriales bacterium]|nr:hypothetical protein [Flavobacteriales bacterium]
MRQSWSSYAILSVVALALAVILFQRLWEQRDRVIEHDVHGYYAFLPALFIYDDIRLEKSDYREVSDQGDYYYFWPNFTPEGKKIIKYPVGLAVLYAPFFFIAHALAHIVDAPTTGFSVPYKIMLLVGAACYLFLGLLLLRSLLRRIGVGERTTALAILVVGSGTNLLCYSSQSATMPHVYGFFLVAAFAYLTVRWFERPLWRYTILLGLVFGLITLVRPTNGVVGLFFLLCGVSRLRDVGAQAQRLLRAWPHLLTMAAITFVVWIPQFLYWHVVTGQFIYYAYQDEGFFFTHPHLIDGLFSFRKGWFVYTPAMAFALIGLFLLKDRALAMRSGIVAVLVVHVYITFSWWCWWYGGTFGQRPMIEIYPLLTLPLCAVIDRIWSAATTIRVVSIGFAACLVLLNIFQTYQYELGLIHYDAMSRELYFKQLGKVLPVEGFHDLLDHPDYDRARKTGR